MILQQRALHSSLLVEVVGQKVLLIRCKTVDDEVQFLIVLEDDMCRHERRHCCSTELPSRIVERLAEISKEGGGAESAPV